MFSEPLEEDLRPNAAGGRMNVVFSAVKDALSLPVISVEAAGVGGNPGRGMLAEEARVVCSRDQKSAPSIVTELNRCEECGDL